MEIVKALAFFLGIGLATLIVAFILVCGFILVFIGVEKFLDFLDEHFD